MQVRTGLQLVSIKRGVVSSVSAVWAQEKGVGGKGGGWWLAKVQEDNEGRMRRFGAGARGRLEGQEQPMEMQIASFISLASRCFDAKWKKKKEFLQTNFHHASFLAIFYPPALYSSLSLPLPQLNWQSRPSGTLSCFLQNAPPPLILKP